MLIYSIVLLFFGLLKVEGLKILFIQTAFTNSHIYFSNRLTALLKSRGHVVDQIILNFNPSAFNGDPSSRNIYKIAPEKPDNGYLKMYASLDPLKHYDGEVSDQDYREFKSSFCAALLDQTELIEKLKKEKYDLGMNTLVNTCGFGLFHLLEIPSWVGYISMQNYAAFPRLFGIPQPYVVSHEIFDVTYHRFPTFDHSSIWRRFINFWYRLRLDLFVTDHMWTDENALFQERFENFPHLNELYAKMSYAFMGTSPILDKPRAITSKVKYLGGVQKDSFKPLPEEYDKLLKNKQGVLFSLGAFANTSNFQKEIKRAIARAFARFPDYVFFWKFNDLNDDVEFFANITNIKRSNWLPQQEILNDPRLKLVITHVGQNSYYEISEAGLPMIVVPLFVDQYYNAACALRNGVAYHIDKTKLNEESMYQALKEVLENPSYSKQAILISKALKTSPINGSEEFLKWSEYAAAFPQISQFETLDTAGMSLIKYLSLDVIFVSFAFFISVVTIVSIIIRLIVCKNKADVEIKKIQ